MRLLPARRRALPVLALAALGLVGTADLAAAAQDLAAAPVSVARRVNQGVAIDIPIVNNGSTTFSMTAAYTPGPAGGGTGIWTPGVTSDCATVAPAGSCTFHVNYNPTQPGTHVAALRLEDGGYVFEVPLTGIATAPHLVASAPSLDLGVAATGGGATSASVTLTNDGQDDALAIGASVTSGSQRFSTDVTACPGVLPPGGGCTVRVLFEPDRRGAAVASVLIGDDYASVPLTVSGTGATVHLAAASALDAGAVAVGTSADASLLLTNDGLDGLALTAATVSAAGDLTGPQYAASLAGCPATLPVGATCALAVRFAPTTLGPHPQLLTISSSAGATIVQLGGRGVTTGLGLAPPTLTAAPPPFARAAAHIAFAGSPGGSFACSVDGSIAAACVSPLVLEGLAEGPHEVLVVERGASGEQSPPVAARWTVDTTAPGRPVVRSTRKGQMAVFTVAAAIDGRLRCRVDRKPFADCGPRLTLRNLRPGAHTFEARLRDEAGNAGPVVRVAWRVVVSTPR